MNGYGGEKCGERGNSGSSPRLRRDGESRFTAGVSSQAGAYAPARAVIQAAVEGGREDGGGINLDVQRWTQRERE